MTRTRVHILLQFATQNNGMQYIHEKLLTKLA